MCTALWPETFIILPTQTRAPLNSDQCFLGVAMPLRPTNALGVVEDPCDVMLPAIHTAKEAADALAVLGEFC